MLQSILNEDWADYDNKKIKDIRDGSKFSCEEDWEVDYVVKKLKKHLPEKSADEIKTAIKLCCTKISAPHSRERFITCVIENLTC
ncbi:MAG: hypothetical protein WCF67_20455 [Chitinophagaceae bacterium]